MILLAPYENVEGIIEDLDTSIDLLVQSVNNLLLRELKSQAYRVRYDNSNITLGLAARQLILSLRKNCIKKDGTLPLAYFAVRTLQDMCIESMSVNFNDEALTGRQRQILQEARLMLALTAERTPSLMEKLVEEERSIISKECFQKVGTLIKNYMPDEHYSRKDGFYRQLNEASYNKVHKLFEYIKKDYTDNNPIFSRFLSDNSWVMFSNLLHGNPIGVLVAADKLEKGATFPFFLLRICTFDAEVISSYLSNKELKTKIKEHRDKIIRKAYG